MDFANDFVKVGGYLVGLVPANVARDGKALSNQPLALGFAPLHDLGTIHCLHMKFGLGASRHPRKRFRGDKHAAMVVEWPLGIESVTSQLFNEFPIRLKDGTIGPGNCIRSA